MEHAVDQRVHILIGRKRLGTGGELLADRGEPALDFLALLEGQNSGPPKGNRPKPVID